MPAHTALTRSLLASGIIAGAMLPIIVGFDGATRQGYGVWRNGVSRLGTGDGAWVFAIVFVLGGALIGLFALGLRRLLRSGRGATWGPIVIALAAVGFIIGGLVPTDPGLGYPPGEPPTATLSGRIHQGAGTLVFGGLSAAAFILARRLRSDARGLASFSLVTGTLIIVFAFAAGIAYRLDSLEIWRPAPAGILEQVSLLTAYGWLIAIGIHYYRTQSVGAST
ncbi:DUF998 domain-containing protein [Arthrobacter sp. 24S4-2]|uniref:DUF998 domain-containing protein n=1 Tax=Arthrobacter sp. 24S4-2 TaxID=2575374 RepID=UPI0010C7E234|nr:DUF998 domain-containing protein [Arthrobacter sp. 24S4-2]QCO98253.1 DUF998 domain-containing protein [Arthrobacter sp. 24S4-2]